MKNHLEIVLDQCHMAVKSLGDAPVPFSFNGALKIPTEIK